MIIFGCIAVIVAYLRRGQGLEPPEKKKGVRVTTTMVVMEAPLFGFIGAGGIMGSGMVRCLLGGGRKCVVWNRDSTKVSALATEFPELVEVATTAADVVKKCETTFSMLSTLEASEAVFPEVLDAVSEGKSIIDCATLTPQRMVEMNDAVLAKGAKFLEAPVSGSKVPALQGQLIFLCGGSDEKVFESIKAELDLMGKASFFFGEFVCLFVCLFVS